MTQRESGSNKIIQALARMNQEGSFPIAVLTDAQGLPISFAADSGYDPERQSAVVAMVQRMALQVSGHLGIETEEVTLNTTGGQRLVCRTFDVTNNRLILAVMVSRRQQTHRRLTSQAIAEIRQVWSQYWE